MHIVITRQASSDSGTPGALTVTNPAGESFACDTLELPWHDNASDVSCICADVYGATPWYSDHMHCEVLRLQDKHGRQDCLIHCGNFAGDAALGFETQVRGCTLVGDRYGWLINEQGRSQRAILDSRATLEGLIAFLGAGEHTVTYTWAPGCAPLASAF